MIFSLCIFRFTVYCCLFFFSGVLLVAITLWLFFLTCEYAFYCILVTKKMGFCFFFCFTRCGEFDYSFCVFMWLICKRLRFDCKVVIFLAALHVKQRELR